MSGFTSENEILNSEIAAHTGRYDRTGKDSYAQRPIRKINIFCKGKLIEWCKTEKEAQEIIEDDIVCNLENDEFVTKKDYETEVIYD